MNIYYSAILGFLQGLTEFIPVSSSGHLALARQFIPGFRHPGVLFEAVLHAGTLFSILVYFRKSILKIRPYYLALILWATVPAGLVGFVFQETFEAFFTNVKIVGLALILTSFLNFFTDKAKTPKTSISLKISFIIGIAQAVAIVPGISRSGATIFAGRTLGITKKEAARFSFLLSMPAVAGANLLQFYKYGMSDDYNILFYLVGFFASFVSGFLAIKIVYKFLTEKKFKYFAIYAFLVGVLALAF